VVATVRARCGDSAISDRRHTPKPVGVGSVQARTVDRR
jgi:hypothetical protein